MPAEQVTVAMLLGSTREGRFSRTVADWFTTRAAPRGDIELDRIDLAELPLPTVHQAPVVSGEYAAPEVRAFAQRIEVADGFVIITPEYNHGYPTALKLAIDSVNPEWHAKPVGFVSYGGVPSTVIAHLCWPASGPNSPCAANSANTWTSPAALARVT